MSIGNMSNVLFSTFLLVLLTCTATWAKQRCCDHVGCFDNNPPFDEMPLPSCEDTIQASMRVFTKETPKNGQVITRTSIPPAFKAGKDVVIIVHGYLQWIGIWWMDDIRNAFLQKYDVNVILAYWEKGAIKIDYRQAASNTRVAGAEIGLVAKNLVDKRLVDREMIWCVGHSLGSHVCGHAGQTYKLGRVTGLDPAGPWFEHKDWSIGINPSAADLVDIWHTNGDTDFIIGFGTFKKLGDIDFYPNGGGFQKGCILEPYMTKNGTKIEDFIARTYMDLTPFCSHLRAFVLFEEAIKTDSCQMNARQFCTDESNIPGSCFDCKHDGICGVMGMEPALKPNNTKLLYLETNGGKPYCIG